MTPTPAMVRFDWEAFGAYLELKRQEHDARTEPAAVAASLAAFERWGVRPPREFVTQHRDALAAMQTGKATTPPLRLYQ